MDEHTRAGTYHDISSHVLIFCTVVNLQEKTQITVSDETIRTHLRANGISFSRPQHKVSSTDLEYLVKKRV